MEIGIKKCFGHIHFDEKHILGPTSCKSNLGALRNSVSLWARVFGDYEHILKFRKIK